jgi:hypothetical protein
MIIGKRRGVLNVVRVNGSLFKWKYKADVSILVYIISTNLCTIFIILCKYMHYIYHDVLSHCSIHLQTYIMIMFILSSAILGILEIIQGKKNISILLRIILLCVMIADFLKCLQYSIMVKLSLFIPYIAAECFILFSFVIHYSTCIYLFNIKLVNELSNPP